MASDKRNNWLKRRAKRTKLVKAVDVSSRKNIEFEAVRERLNAIAVTVRLKVDHEGCYGDYGWVTPEKAVKGISQYIRKRKALYCLKEWVETEEHRGWGTKEKKFHRRLAGFVVSAELTDSGEAWLRMVSADHPSAHLCMKWSQWGRLFSGYGRNDNYGRNDKKFD